MMKRHLKAAIFDAAAGDPVLRPAHGSGQAAGDQPAEVFTRRGRQSHQAEQRREEDHFRHLQRRKVRGTRRMVVLLAALGLVVGTGAVAVSALWPVVTSLTESNDYTGAGSGSASIVVHGGDSSRAIGAALEKSGVVKTARAFADAAAGNPRSGSIQPGTYALHSKMSAASALTMLLNRVNRTVPRITVREGLWTSEIIVELAAATGRPLADYTRALQNPVLLGLPVQAKGNAEGYLFPSTYEFEVDAPAAEQLQMMVAKCLEQLRRLGVTPANAQRVLTVASIVEAETRAKADGPKVARVIENRLATPMPLQLDTTVAFISHKRGKAGTTDAERAARSLYNTYLVPGLPPGPIDSPGVSAMRAAIHPAAGPWFYFVAVNPDTGETRFAVDAAGHAANVKLFQAWCSKNPAHC